MNEAAKSPESAEAAKAETSAEVDPSGAIDAVTSLEARLSAAPNDLAVADASFARITAPTDLDRGVVDADPVVAEAKRELDAVSKDGQALVGRAKGRAGGLLSRMRRFAGAAGVATAMTFLEACATMGAGAKPEAGIEHVERSPEEESRRVKAEMREAALADATLHADFEKRFGSKEVGDAKLVEFLDTFEQWDEEAVRKGYAELAGLDPSAISKENFRKIEILSEARFKEESDRAVARKELPLSPRMDAMAEDDIIRFRPSRYIRADGSIDKAKIVRGMNHEKAHVLSTKMGPDGRQERQWDKENVPSGLNEGVTELLSLRNAERRGEKIGEQAYAGGELVAARLLEGIVGTEALAADYLEGKTDRVRKALEAKLGAGAYEAIMTPDFASRINEPEGLSSALDIMKAAAAKGIDVEALWAAAKAEGFIEDVHALDGGKGIMVSREIQGTFVLANAAYEDGAKLSPHGKPLRVFARAIEGGHAYGPEALTAQGHALRKTVQAVERVHAEVTKRYEDAEREGAAKGETTFASPEVRKESFDIDVSIESGMLLERVGGNKDGMVDLNVAEQIRPLQEAYAAAGTPSEKAAARAAVERRVAELVKAASDDLWKAVK